MRKTKGYTTLTAQAIFDANPCLPGPKLGRLCVRLSIPVADVAEYLGVSRPTVYSWFIGKSNVPAKHLEKVEQLIQKLA